MCCIITFVDALNIFIKRVIAILLILIVIIYISSIFKFNFSTIKQQIYLKLEKGMSDFIGINKTGINQKIILGKEVGRYDTKEEAEKAATRHDGSEIIFEKDSKWQVNEIRENGIFFGENNLTKKDKAEITINSSELKNFQLSFVEDDYSNFLKLPLIVNPATLITDGNSPTKAGTILRQGSPTKDFTSHFKKLYAAAMTGKNVIPKEAKNYCYLSVEGLYGNQLPGYMNPNINKLRGAGLQVSDVPIDTGAGVKVNAKVVYDAIIKAAKESGKKVIIMGHSKGGVDTTAALSLYPDLKQYVRAVITLQSPYGGTPIASDIVSNPSLLEKVNKVASKAMGANPESLKDLTYENRIQFVKEHPYPEDIPTVSLATSRLSPGSALFHTEEYMFIKYKLPSDGLVPAIDQEIPGSRVVRLDNLDHANSTFDSSLGCEYDPGNITQALLAIALKP